MLEILLLVSLCKKIGQSAEDKGHSPKKYQWMLVGFWFGGEIGVGLLTLALLEMIHGGEADNFAWMAYIAAIAGAALGALIAFMIVKNLREVQDDYSDDRRRSSSRGGSRRVRDYDEDDYEDNRRSSLPRSQPRRFSSSDDDDSDDTREPRKPIKRKRLEEDY